MHWQHTRQRLVLGRFLNGDLTQPHINVHSPYLYRADAAARASLLQEIRRWVLPALVPRCCPLFSRSRWNGADDAVQWLGLLAGHHRGVLLRGMIFKFVDQPAPKPLPMRNVEEDWLLAVASEVAAPVEEDAGEALPEDEDAGAGGGDPAAMDGGDDVDEFHRRNKQYRRKAAALVARDVFSDVASLGVATRHLQQLRARLFARARVVWRQQKYQEVLQGRPRHRCSKLLEVMESKDTAEFNEALFGSLERPCRLLGEPFNTQAGRSLLFRSEARAGGTVHQLLVMRRRGFPLDLFRLLLNPNVEEAAALLHSATPNCLLDELSHDFLQRYSTPERLVSTEALAILAAIAARREYDICAIECRHAACRRIKGITSQTWEKSLHHVSAAWTIAQHKLSSQGTLGSRKPASHTTAPSSVPAAESDAADRPKQQRRRSSWLAFVHEKTKGQNRRGRYFEGMSTVKAQYRALSAEERARYQSMADTASAAVGLGAPGFRETADERARRRRGRLEARAAVAPALEAGAGDALEPGFSSLAYGLPRELARQKAARLSAARDARQQARQMRLDLEAFAREHPAPVEPELADADMLQASSTSLPEMLQTAEFCPPTMDMAQACGHCRV